MREAGNDPATTCLTLLMHSDDGGRNWSQPRDVSASVKRDAPVTSVATGPGVGIQLQRGARAGRVLMPFNQGPVNRWCVYAARSAARLHGHRPCKADRLQSEEPEGEAFRFWAKESG